MVACEVDDLVITGNDTKGIVQLRKYLTDTYAMTDWPRINSFLGVNINYKPDEGVLEMDTVDKIKSLFKQHGIVNSSHNVPQRDSPLDDDYSKIPVDPGAVKYNAVEQ